MTRTSPAQGAREASIVIMINMWKVFALLALLYIIPVHNPIHSLPWWAVTIPLWFVPFFKVAGRSGGTSPRRWRPFPARNRFSSRKRKPPPVQLAGVSRCIRHHPDTHTHTPRGESSRLGSHTNHGGTNTMLAHGTCTSVRGREQVVSRTGTTTTGWRRLVIRKATWHAHESRTTGRIPSSKVRWTDSQRAPRCAVVAHSPGPPS